MKHRQKIDGDQRKRKQPAQIKSISQIYTYKNQIYIQEHNENNQEKNLSYTRLTVIKQTNYNR